MKLSEFFELLEYGELANLTLSGGIDDAKEIRVQDYSTLITHLNLALSDLHTKFNLKERELAIQQYETIAYYTISSEFALTNTTSTEPIKYIADTEANPYTDDLIRVNAVFDEGGNELPINDEHRSSSVFLNAYNVLQIPYPDNANAVFVMYRANHAKLNASIPDLDAEVDVPTYCVEALLSYVASRVHMQKTSQESQATAVNLMAKYNMLCDQIELRNVLHTSPNNTNLKLGGNGWV
tara:strand:- start:65822 stop:66535 length:714 start_codon:yes stop_codon:yes gene_type:complete